MASVALRMPRVLERASCSRVTCGRRHQPRAGGFGKNADRVVIVRRGAKAAVPPRVVKRVCQHAFETRGLKISGDLVTDQSDLPQQQRRDVWIRRIVKRRNEESRSVRALLVNVVNNLRKPFVPQQSRDELASLSD